MLQFYSLFKASVPNRGLIYAAANFFYGIPGLNKMKKVLFCKKFMYLHDGRVWLTFELWFWQLRKNDVFYFSCSISWSQTLNWWKTFLKNTFSQITKSKNAKEISSKMAAPTPSHTSSFSLSEQQPTEQNWRLRYN